jgi:hypothetical protein
MSAHDRDPLARLLIALPTEGREDFEPALFRLLIGEMQAELEALFIEDARLAAHAGSRLAREIVLSGQERPLEPATLERQWRARATAMRRRFAAAAAALGWRHEFRVVRAEPLAALEAAAGAADFMIVADAEHGAGSRTWSAADLHRLAAPRLRALLVARAGWTRGREVIAVLTEEADAELAPGSVLGTALRLANETGSMLGIVLAGRAAAALADLVAAELPAGLARGRTVLVVPDIGALAAALRGRDARVLVLPAATAADERLVAALLVSVSSSLLWVR